MSEENTLNVEQHIDHLIETSLQKLNITGTKNEKNEDSNTPADVDGFNTALHQYLEIEEEIKVLLTALKQRNQKKKELGLSLSSYLQDNKINNVNLNGSYQGKKLVSTVSTKSVGFNKVSVTEAIYDELKNDEDIFSKIMEAISKKSVIKEIYNVKIINEKAKSKKEKIQDNLSTAEALLED
tara:strand:+ start:146 stop:691 length:546 start_codon:yes stop_codon:yes gene_type:complete